MNTKHSFWNRLFAALLLAVMLVTQTTTAFAVEDSPEPTEPSMVQAQDSDTGTEEAGECTDTPEDESPSEGPETALQTASSLEELLQAIEQAEAGATIGIGCEIVCPDGTVLGDTYKRVTLRRTAPEGHISTYSPDGTGNVIIQANAAFLIARLGPLKLTTGIRTLDIVFLSETPPNTAHISA